MIFLYQRIKGLVSAPVGSPRCGSHALRIPAALPREAAQPWPGLHLGSSIECWSAWYSMLVASKMASNISNKYTAKPSIFEVLMILTHSWNGFDKKKVQVTVVGLHLQQCGEVFHGRRKVWELKFRRPEQSVALRRLVTAALPLTLLVWSGSGYPRTFGDFNKSPNIAYAKGAKGKTPTRHARR